MTTEIIARCALGLMFAATAIGNWKFYGRPHRGNVNGFVAMAVLTVEIGLIWLAGGWG